MLPEDTAWGAAEQGVSGPPDPFQPQGPVQGVTLNPVLPPAPRSCQLACLGGALGEGSCLHVCSGEIGLCVIPARPALLSSTLARETPAARGSWQLPSGLGSSFQQGEEYVVLKQGSREAAPGLLAGMALWEGRRAGPAEGPAMPHILVTDVSASSPGGQSPAAWGSPATAPNPQPEPEPPRAAEEDAESVSKPASEQEASEDGGSSLGSSPVALDLVEKEWLQGAASGHLLTLSHLLKQEPSLATRKDFTSVSTGPCQAHAPSSPEQVAQAGAGGGSRNGPIPLHCLANPRGAWGKVKHLGPQTPVKSQPLLQLMNPLASPVLHGPAPACPLPALLPSPRPVPRPLHLQALISCSLSLPGR
ncbi:uncharacterized protein [Lepidochelys kempii]|uniref:uncharacterized protein isoform X2 n=1 Tax=Lepidochelys kempii TaxID=8472 RepID=UPI003C6FD3F6